MPKTVLIADESITIRSVAESLLRGEAYSVRSAADGNMAMELAGAEQPDLILVGEKLPGISGADVCAQLKGNPATAAVPIIFMRTDRPGDSPENVDAVLIKPFSPQTLLDSVERFLGGNATDVGAQDVVAIQDDSLEEELIDKALGLDDVGGGTVEEMKTAGPRTDSTPAPEDEPVADFETAEFNSTDTEDTPELPKDETASLKDFEVQVGLEDRAANQSPAKESSADDDIDAALDAAFGDSTPQPKQASAPIQPPQPSSSLNEISLGDPQKMELPEVSAQPPAGPPSAAPEPPDDPEHPHDYEWFIAEMEKETDKPATASPKAQDGPRIEPVQPQAKETPAPPTPKTDSGTRSSEFDIDVEEFEASKRGYDEFISEFRKEIAKLEGAVPSEDASGGADNETKHTTRGAVAFGDSKDSMRQNADIKALGDRLIEAVAQSVARELAAKVDPKTVYALIDAKLSEIGKPQS